MMDVGIRIPDSQHASAPRSQPVMLQTALWPPENQREGSAIEKHGHRAFIQETNENQEGKGLRY